MAEFDGEWIALEMVDLIIDKTSSKLYDNYITSREIPFAAGSVLKDVYDVVRTAFVKRDSGNLKPEEDSSWVAEKEPHSTQCDTWARGAVAVKKRPKPKKEKVEEKPKGYGFGAVRKQSTSKKKKKERAFDDDSDDEDILIRTVGTPTDPVQMGVKRRHGDKDMTATELASAKELQAIEDKEAAERSRRQQIIEQEKAEIDAHEKLVRDLKGKDYTFDQNGNVILISAMSKDSLRPLHTNLGVSVQNVVQQEEVFEEQPKKSRKANKKKKNKDNAKAVLSASTPFFTSTLLQPSILSSVSLNPGVDIMEGEKKKAGPRRRAAKGKMSRKDFLSHQNSLESKSPKLVASKTMAGQQALGGASMGMDVSAASALGSPKGMMTSMSMPAMDPSNLAVDNSAEQEQRALAMRLAKAQQSAPRPGDSNVLLTKSADWGANVRQSDADFNPAPVAGKQNVKQQELQTKLMGGPQVRNPRDRPFVSSSPTAHRKKLPAPPLGLTTGHGVAVSGHGDGLLPSIRGAGDSYLGSSQKSKGFKSLKQSTRGGKVVRNSSELDDRQG